jgi:serine protease Do
MERKFVALAVTAAFVSGLALSGLVEDSSPVRLSHAVPTSAEPVATAGAPAPLVGLPDFSALVEREGPAVVNIAVAKKVAANAAPRGDVPPGADPFEFFRRFGPQAQPQPQPGPGEDEPAQRGTGSGFIVSSDGYILTNTHVVQDADEVTVTLTDRREFKARVIGADDRTDVALIKIDATGLPSVRIGDPGRTKVGSWVAAIGSPFGLENTVTAGIVSAKSRTLPSDAYVPFIQTDVAVNPGNSGGPLFNLAGEVVGINSQIYSRTGGYMGLSFAIPIDVAMKVKQDLLAFGKVQRGRIGVVIQQVDKDLAGSFGLDRARGALVSGVEKSGPAEAAGLKVGDVILAVNGKPVEQSVDLPRMIGEGRPGAEVRLQVWRDRASKEIGVKLGETPTRQAALDKASPVKASALGLVVRPITPSEKQRLGATEGVVVERSEGAAAKAGIRPGDVILSLNSEPVASGEALKQLIAKAHDRVAVLVQREDARFFVPVPIS